MGERQPDEGIDYSDGHLAANVRVNLNPTCVGFGVSLRSILPSEEFATSKRAWRARLLMASGLQMPVQVSASCAHLIAIAERAPKFAGHTT